MKAQEVKDAILKNLKITVTKTFDAKGNDNDRQHREMPQEKGNAFPLRLEDFEIRVSLHVPKELDIGHSGFDMDNGGVLEFGVRRRTPMTQETAKLYDELAKEITKD